MKKYIIAFKQRGTGMSDLFVIGKQTLTPAVDCSIAAKS
jgi:hypothetical protein